MNQGEKLERVLTLTEVQAAQITEMRNDIKAIREDLDAEKAANAALRNKGAGILIGVTLFAGAVGASLASVFEWLASLAK